MTKQQKQNSYPSFENFNIYFSFNFLQFHNRFEDDKHHTTAQTLPGRVHRPVAVGTDRSSNAKRHLLSAGLPQDLFAEDHSTAMQLSVSDVASTRT